MHYKAMPRYGTENYSRRPTLDLCHMYMTFNNEQLTPVIVDDLTFDNHNSTS